MKFNMMRRRPVNLEGLPEYRERVEAKLSGGQHSFPRCSSRVEQIRSGFR